MNLLAIRKELQSLQGLFNPKSVTPVQQVCEFSDELLFLQQQLRGYFHFYQAFLVAGSTNAWRICGSILDALVQQALMTIGLLKMSKDAFPLLEFFSVDRFTQTESIFT